MTGASKGNPTVRPSGFFALRTPLLPFDELMAWGRNLEAPGVADDPDRLPSALAADLARLRARLVELADRPELQEALFLASPDLLETLGQWRSRPGWEKARRLENALVRYFVRMVARPTPFGLFAGCSVGTLGSETRLELAARADYRRHSRLDTDYLVTLCEAMARDPSIVVHLKYRPNSSLYETGGRLRYAEASVADGSRSYRLVAVEKSDHLSRVLAHAERGATLPELAESIVDDEISYEEAIAFAQEIAQAQILVPELTPALTGPEPIHDLLDQLRPHSAAGAAMARLQEAQQGLEVLDRMPLGAGVERYRAIAGDLATISAPASVAKLFQVDMVKPAATSFLSPAIVEEIVQAVDLLHGLRRETDRLESFRKRFRDRYEREERPLLEVLDEETGIGFESSAGPEAEPSPFFEGLQFPEPPLDPTVPWERLDALLLRKLVETASAGRLVLELSAAELKTPDSAERQPLPEAFSVMATVAAASTQALARDEFELCFWGLAGPSGARMLARFCHGDSQLLEWVSRHLHEEEALNPDAIYAEVIHLPEGRAANVVLRPVLRGYEIPLLGRSGAVAEGQIPLADLLVSVEGERVRLRSKRLDREVIPRLSTAHNFGFRSLGVYRFLCTLQQQNATQRLAWSWGVLDASPFLPRVRVGKVVLSRARWRVDGEDFRRRVSGDEAEKYRHLQVWRRERQLPRFVQLLEDDLRLLVDLDNALCVRMFVDFVAARRSFVLEELYPGPGELCCAGPEGSFVHELVIPFTAGGPAVRKSPGSPARPAIGLSPARDFTPGSEWLYAKIYTGPAAADTVLREAVHPFVTDALQAGSIDQWFFIRYGDPDSHLRLRLHGRAAEIVGEVLPRLHALHIDLQRRGLSYRLQLDTYVREIERYGGGEAILLAERFFHLNSEAALEIVRVFADDAGGLARWRLCLMAMDMLLDDMGFDPAAKLEIALAGRTGYLHQFKADTASFRRRLGDRFRQERRDLEALLGAGTTHAGPLAPGLAALREQSRQFRADITPFLNRLAAEHALTVPLASIVASYLHMHVNRFSRWAGPAHELVLYDFLSRLYESNLARTGRLRPKGQAIR